MTSMSLKTERAQRELPPELVDRIIDFLHDQPKALAACSLVARSWTATSRYHRFGKVVLSSDDNWEEFDRLIKISPTIIHHIRGIIIDTSCERWISACASFTSLEHITIFGAIIPPWQSEAAGISSVAHKITSLTLNVAFVSRHDFWPIVRMFPNLVSFSSVATRGVTELPPLRSLPCYSPPISSVSLESAAQKHVLDHLCNPPYPLTSLSTLHICDVDRERGPELRALAETYASQISRLRLYVQTYTHQYSPDYVSCFTNLRHLTFTDLHFNPRDGNKWRHGEKSFAWVHNTIAALQSPITHLTIEVLTYQPATLKAVDWKAIDVLLSRREVFRSLVQVSVVFLDRLKDGNRDPESIAHPVTIRRLMPSTSVMGLLNVVTRGPKFHSSR